MTRTVYKGGIVLFFGALLAFNCFADSPLPRIRYHKYVLPNGMTLLVVPNHREPIVAVSVWYHVGSKDDVSSRSGLAHFFEHIMFEGSEHHPANFIRAFEQIGATGINGVTNRDRTAYFETVPAVALDYTLWLEADRMGHLLGAVDQSKLAAQIDVVENEKRQGESGSYALARQLIAENTYPHDHPYRRSIIGDISTLRAASLGDLKNWTDQYYTCSNTVLLLAGDVRPEIAKQKVAKYFGDFAPGIPVPAQPEWIAKMTGNRRQTVHGHVPQPRLYKVWNIPGFGAADANALDLISDCLNEEFRDMNRTLGEERRSDEEHAIEAKASVQLGELGGQFRIDATVLGGSMGDADRKLDKLVKRFLERGPTPSQLERVKKHYARAYVESLDALSGTGSAAERLAQGQLFRSDPDLYWKVVQRTLKITPGEMQSAARRWLNDGCYSLELVPGSQDGADPVSEQPRVETFGGPKLPMVQRAKLSSGMQIMLVERHELPIVELTMVIGSGYSTDAAGQPGVACLTTAMLDSSTSGRSASDQLADIGASLHLDCKFEMSTITVSALSAEMTRMTDILAKLIIRPSFSEADLREKRKLELTSVEAEARSPLFMALQAVSSLLYDSRSASPNPLVRAATAEDLRRITLDDLRKFHRQWFRASNATVLVVGDTTMQSVRPLLERSFKSWTSGPPPISLPNRAREFPVHGIYFIDKPGASQSFILAGTLGLRKADPADVAAELVIDTLGGTLGSRLNMTLREQKHWSYGVSSRFYETKQRQPLITYTSVQRDKTADAIAEMKKEFAAIRTDRPVAADELSRSQEYRLLSLAASVETVSSTTESLINVLAYQLPDDYLGKLPERISRLTTAELQDAANQLIHPEDIVWVVVGDRAFVEPELKRDSLGELHSLNLVPR